jgi:MoaA/NifB/PqqE/SkfB family radical SAM enzyme
MLTGIHFLLTYECNMECDHCFVYSAPRAKGTFTIDQIQAVLDEADRIGTVEWIYVEGGEPFLYYPIMAEGIRMASERGYRTGTVTNSYWATSEADAELWLGPLRDLGIGDVSISDDAFHHEEDDPRPDTARSAAERLGLKHGTITIDEPRSVCEDESDRPEGPKGEPIVEGGACLRGRAADKLTDGLPKRPWVDLDECPGETLDLPTRVHVDAFGWVHICQGLVMGNMWDVPLSELIDDYDGGDHPICGPLLEGGPALLAERYGVRREDGYISACHLCYEARKALLDRFPDHLAPPQIYGLGNE